MVSGVLHPPTPPPLKKSVCPPRELIFHVWFDVHALLYMKRRQKKVSVVGVWIPPLFQGSHPGLTWRGTGRGHPLTHQQASFSNSGGGALFSQVPAQRHPPPQFWALCGSDPHEALWPWGLRCVH